MPKYKLKKEARQFFEKNLHKEVRSLIFWNNQTISQRLLDEVDKCYIEYGVKRGENRTDLSGWSSNFGEPNGYFQFTVHVNDLSNESYKDINIAEVMDEIQKTLNKYFLK